MASSPLPSSRSRTWPPALRILGQEVEVEPRHVQAAGEVRESVITNGLLRQRQRKIKP